MTNFTYEQLVAMNGVALAEIHNTVCGGNMDRARNKPTTATKIIARQTELAEIAAAATPVRANRNGSVAKVHAICAANPEARRIDLIALCVAEGINAGTARTQIQTYKTKNR